MIDKVESFFGRGRPCTSPGAIERTRHIQNSRPALSSRPTPKEPLRLRGSGGIPRMRHPRCNVREFSRELRRLHIRAAIGDHSQQAEDFQRVCMPRSDKINKKRNCEGSGFINRALVPYVAMQFPKRALALFLVTGSESPQSRRYVGRGTVGVADLRPIDSVQIIAHGKMNTSFDFRCYWSAVWAVTTPRSTQTLGKRPI